MIKIQDYDNEKQKLSFVTDMPLSLANGIRRSVLEIPIMAIDEVEIFKNDTALYDEIIAHRLGLVPIKTTSLKETKFKLKAKGPKIVSALDLQPAVGIDYEIPITILDQDQEIEIVAHANLGKGIDHIKYSPGLIYYKHNLDSSIIDFVSVDESNKIIVNEEELKNKNVPEEEIANLKKLKEINELVFNIESWGQIEVKEIFLKSIDVLNKNLDELNKAIK